MIFLNPGISSSYGITGRMIKIWINTLFEKECMVFG